jgi:hypothetical protein
MPLKWNILEPPPKLRPTHAKAIIESELNSNRKLEKPNVWSTDKQQSDQNVREYAPSPKRQMHLNGNQLGSYCACINRFFSDLKKIPSKFLLRNFSSYII